MRWLENFSGFRGSWERMMIRRMHTELRVQSGKTATPWARQTRLCFLFDRNFAARSKTPIVSIIELSWTLLRQHRGFAEAVPNERRWSVVYW